jgi:hypothetical protein
MITLIMIRFSGILNQNHTMKLSSKSKFSSIFNAKIRPKPTSVLQMTGLITLPSNRSQTLLHVLRPYSTGRITQWILISQIFQSRWTSLFSNQAFPASFLWLIEICKAHIAQKMSLAVTQTHGIKKNISKKVSLSQITTIQGVGSGTRICTSPSS